MREQDAAASDEVAEDADACIFSPPCAGMIRIRFDGRSAWIKLPLSPAHRTRGCALEYSGERVRWAGDLGRRAPAAAPRAVRAPPRPTIVVRTARAAARSPGSTTRPSPTRWTRPRLHRRARPAAEARPRRSPLRAGVVVPLLTAVGVRGAYAAATLLWPLWAVAPTVREITPDGPVATAATVAWPAGCRRRRSRGIRRRRGIVERTRGRWRAFQGRHRPDDPRRDAAGRRTVRAGVHLHLAGPPDLMDLADDESALDVPVGGTLKRVPDAAGHSDGLGGQLHQSTRQHLWPTEVFAQAARAWLDRHGLGAITLSEPTGIDPANTAEPAALVNWPDRPRPPGGRGDRPHPHGRTARGRGHQHERSAERSRRRGPEDRQPGGVLQPARREGHHRRLHAGARYATALGQPTAEARDQETARLLSEVTAEVSTPPTLPAGTLAGVVSTAWGVTANKGTHL